MISPVKHVPIYPHNSFTKHIMSVSFPSETHAVEKVEQRDSKEGQYPAHLLQYSLEKHMAMCGKKVGPVGTRRIKPRETRWVQQMSASLVDRTPVWRLSFITICTGKVL